VSPRHSNQAVAALRTNRIPVEYIVFPDEGDRFRKAQNNVRATVAITGWFEKYL
jgi:dipeptidyl aminopeptidase/acylaminoacyl peptidase